MLLPSPRGHLSAEVVGLLRSSAPVTVEPNLLTAADDIADPLHDGDLQLALACLYELHYRGFDDAGRDHEWDPDLLRLRAALEHRLESALRAGIPAPAANGDVGRALRELVDRHEGPSVSSYLLKSGTVEQFRDFLTQRSVYHLKEADPHTWQLPRLAGRAKEALAEIQADEYGGGIPGRAHASLFATSMRALGLDDTYGALWGAAMAETLAGVNVMSMLGLHRRHRAAALGHLAALEMTSTEPNRRYANGLRRLGFGMEATAYFDEHVEADAVHEQVAAVDLCGSFVAAEPDLGSAVLWGAACCLELDRLAGEALLDMWDRDARGAA